MQQTVIDNRYILSYLLGEGGTAKVFLARDEVLDRDVALKILREQYAKDGRFVESFEREAQSAAALSHRNIVPLYDRGDTGNGTYYIAMVYLPGGTLGGLIVEEGPLDAGEATHLSSQVAEGLRAAHERGIVHRDVKPRNVLLTERGDAKVTDFGIARAAATTAVSWAGFVIGSAR
jgi:serine/threonine protein kinase